MYRVETSPAGSVFPELFLAQRLWGSCVWELHCSREAYVVHERIITSFLGVSSVSFGEIGLQWELVLRGKKLIAKKINLKISFLTSNCPWYTRRESYYCYHIFLRFSFLLLPFLALYFPHSFLFPFFFPLLYTPCLHFSYFISPFHLSVIIYSSESLHIYLPPPRFLRLPPPLTFPQRSPTPSMPTTLAHLSPTPSYPPEPSHHSIFDQPQN